MYTVAYTCSHTLDDSNSALNNTNGSRILVGANGAPLLSYNYGNSDAD